MVSEVSGGACPTPRSLRITIIVQNLPVPLDRRVWLECRSLVAAGHRVSVICPKGPGDPSRQLIDEVRIYKYAPPPSARGVVGYAYEFAYCWLRTALLLLRIWRRDGLDVIQACNPPDTFFALAAPLKLLGKRFVYDQHDLCPETYISRFGKPRAGLAYRALLALERGTYLTADQVISTNESYRRVACERGGMAPERVTVVRSGPDPERLRRTTPDESLKRGRAHLVCYVGVMGPQDGVDLVVRAAAEVVHRLGRRDIAFAVIGGGDCYDDVKGLAAELEVNDLIDMPGRVSDERLFAYLSTASVGLSPDPPNPLNDVSTMNKTMEYMAFGLPVVAFDLKETRVSAGEAGRFVAGGDVGAYAEAIVELIDDEGLRARLGTEGRQRIERELAWSHQVRAYLDVYERFLPAVEPSVLEEVA
jgi:glycosyltransferase involved in cell wall biosynthesis